MSNEEKDKVPESIEWPEFKDEDGNVIEAPSRWTAEWFIDPSEPEDMAHVKMTFKGDKFYMFMYEDIERRLDEETMRSYLDEITDEVQSDEDWEEIKIFFDHFLRTVDNKGGGTTWEAEDANEDGPQNYHLPYNGPAPGDE
jgi:hypothetical protein